MLKKQGLKQKLLVVCWNPSSFEKSSLIVFRNAEALIWMPVIRYDSAHGSSHIDHYTPDGKKKKAILDLDLNTALTLADWDVNNNWEQYVKKFLEE